VPFFHSSTRSTTTYKLSILIYKVFTWKVFSVLSSPKMALYLWTPKKKIYERTSHILFELMAHPSVFSSKSKFLGGQEIHDSFMIVVPVPSTMPVKW
jgi:hypothetical protein